jgi:hypothetical protein
MLKISKILIPNPLHVFEENLLAAAVIEFRCPAVGVTGDPLSGFKGALIFQKMMPVARNERGGLRCLSATLQIAIRSISSSEISSWRRS